MGDRHDCALCGNGRRWQGYAFCRDCTNRILSDPRWFARVGETIDLLRDVIDGRPPKVPPSPFGDPLAPVPEIPDLVGPDAALDYFQGGERAKTYWRERRKVLAQRADAMASEVEDAIDNYRDFGDDHRAWSSLRCAADILASETTFREQAMDALVSVRGAQARHGRGEAPRANLRPVPAAGAPVESEARNGE